MPPHNLQHKRATVTERSRIDTIDRLANPMQGSRSANRHIRHTHIVVDAAYESNDLEMSVFLDLLVGDLVLLAQG